MMYVPSVTFAQKKVKEDNKPLAENVSLVHAVWYVPLASAGCAYLCVPILMVDMLIFFAGCSADMER